MYGQNYGRGGGQFGGGWNGAGRGRGRGQGWGQQGVVNPPGTGKRAMARARAQGGGGFGGGGWATPKQNHWQGGSNSGGSSGGSWAAQGQAAARMQQQLSHAKLEKKAERSQRKYSKAKDEMVELRAQQKSNARMAASTAAAMGMIDVTGQRGMYRVPRVTTATDRRAAVRTLANTFMRIVDNCTHEMHAVNSIKLLAKQVQKRANYTKSMTKAAWRGLVDNARYTQFGRRWTWAVKAL